MKAKSNDINPEFNTSEDVINQQELNLSYANQSKLAKLIHNMRYYLLIILLIQTFTFDATGNSPMNIETIDSTAIDVVSLNTRIAEVEPEYSSHQLGDYKKTVARKRKQRD